MARAQNKERDTVIKVRQWQERIMTTNDKTGIYHERLSAATAPLIGSIISQCFSEGRGRESRVEKGKGNQESREAGTTTLPVFFFGTPGPKPQPPSSSKNARIPSESPWST